jgi:hypothetical protein
MTMTTTPRRLAPVFVALVLLATVLRGPAIYFCPHMGALPKPCCAENQPDRAAGACCNLISVEHAKFQAGTVSLPDLEPVSAALPVLPAPLSLVPHGSVAGHIGLIELDRARSAPPDLYLLDSSFLC